MSARKTFFRMMAGKDVRKICKHNYEQGRKHKKN